MFSKPERAFSWRMHWIRRDLKGLGRGKMGGGYLKFVLELLVANANLASRVLGLIAFLFLRRQDARRDGIQFGVI